MKVMYSRSGSERKALVCAIAEFTGAAAVYKGAPSFSYGVGGFIVDKDGTVSSEDAAALTALAGALAARGYEGTADAVLEVPATQPAHCVGGGRLAVEYPAAGFSYGHLQNLEKLVESKSALIKKATGADALPIEQAGDIMRFPWFPGDAGVDAEAAYQKFIKALCETARNQKRVTAEPRAVENEKYAFRCFLLRLGFIGDDYKAARKILMANLSGNGSFKNNPA